MRKQFALALGLILIALTSCAYAQQKDETKTPPQNTPREFAGPPVAGTITSVGVDRLEIKKMDGSTQTVMVDEHTRYPMDNRISNLKI